MENPPARRVSHILEVMTAKDIVDCIVVITRYFGGTLLGTGGLTRAYAHAASQAIDAAGVCAMHETVRLSMQVPYPLWDRVEYSLQSLPICVETTQYSDTVTVTLLCRSEDQTPCNRRAYQNIGRQAFPKANRRPVLSPLERMKKASHF